MTRGRFGWVALVVLVAAAAIQGWAHKPISIGETFGSSDRALVLEEIDTSQVVYALLAPDAPQLWLTFEIEAPAELYLSLGIPAIERLRGYQPSVAVVGPGLPQIELPIPVPASRGVVFRGRTPDDDSLFFEPFTGTESWITVEETVALPEAGRYFVVAWATQETADKLWVAIGVRERFGLRDVLTLPSVTRDVRAFHEVPPRRIRVRWETVLVVAVMAGAIGRALSR